MFSLVGFGFHFYSIGNGESGGCQRRRRHVVVIAVIGAQARVKDGSRNFE